MPPERPSIHFGVATFDGYGNEPAIFIGGTPYMIADIEPGQGSSNPQWLASTSSGLLFAYQGSLYALNGDHVEQLITTYSDDIRILHQTDDAIIFAPPHNDVTHSAGFYVRDGTAADGTREVYSSYEGSFASLQAMRFHDGELYVPVIEDDNDRAFIAVIGENSSFRTLDLQQEEPSLGDASAYLARILDVRPTGAIPPELNLGNMLLATGPLTLTGQGATVAGAMPGVDGATIGFPFYDYIAKARSLEVTGHYDPVGGAPQVITFEGTAHSDRIDASSATGAVMLHARSYSGNDTLIGTVGADILDGGEGNDALTGGAGGDIFFFRPGFGADTIDDFQPGLDRVDLTSLPITYADLSMTDLDSGVQMSISGSGMLKRLDIHNPLICPRDFVFD